MKIDIGKIDPAMAIKPANADGIAWHLPFEKPMELLGFYWFEQDGKYDRLPIATRPEKVTQYPDGVKKVIPNSECGAFLLSPCTAGGQIRFRTNSSKLMAKVKLLNQNCMWHMAPTGTNGFDVYRKCGDTWRFIGITKFGTDSVEMSSALFEGIRRDEVADYVINFPLYNGVQSLSIGLDEDAVLEAPTPFEDPRPIVFYGTSITQGGCCTRPGMASSNILSRMLDRQVINLGFSGSGRGEPEIADMMAEIENPSMYILDYAWNSQSQEMAVTLPDIIDTLRKRHPDIPVILVSPTPGLGLWNVFEVTFTDLAARRDVMLHEYERRIGAGDKNIYFFDAFNDALGDNPMECLVDGCHMTDLGFLRFSEGILPIIKSILK